MWRAPHRGWVRGEGGRAETADNPPPQALSARGAPVGGELWGRARRAMPRDPWMCPQEQESTWAKVTSGVKNIQRVQAR